MHGACAPLQNSRVAINWLLQGHSMLH